VDYQYKYTVNHKKEWNYGEIIEIIKDDNHNNYCLDVRYWTLNQTRSKFVEIDSNDIKMIPNGKTRFEWSRGDKVKCWSHSKHEWYNAIIMDIIEYSDGINEDKKWLKLKWKMNKHSYNVMTMTKEIARTSMYVRHCLDGCLTQGHSCTASSYNDEGEEKNKTEELLKEIEELKIQIEDAERLLEDEKDSNCTLLKEYEHQKILISCYKENLEYLIKQLQRINDKNKQLIHTIEMYHHIYDCYHDEREN